MDARSRAPRDRRCLLRRLDSVRALHLRDRSEARKRVQALGGAKNVIVMPDAELDAAVDGVLVRVPRRRPALPGELGLHRRRRCLPAARASRKKCSAMVVGNGADPETEVGPVISSASQERILGWIEKGASEGSLVLDGRGRGSRTAHRPDDHRVRARARRSPGGDLRPRADAPQGADLGEAEILNSSTKGNAASIFTTSGGAMRRFLRRGGGGDARVNIGVAAPMAYFPFTGLEGLVLRRPARTAATGSSSTPRRRSSSPAGRKSEGWRRRSSTRPPSRRTGACSRTAPTRSTRRDLDARAPRARRADALRSRAFIPRRAVGRLNRGSARSEAVVARREEDGRSPSSRSSARWTSARPGSARPAPELLALAERDCFVGASLTAARYQWRVNGRPYRESSHPRRNALPRPASDRSRLLAGTGSRSSTAADTLADLFPEVEKLQGDRQAGNLDALRGRAGTRRSTRAVTSPAWCASRRAPGRAVERTFASSLSVFTPPAKQGRRSSTGDSALGRGSEDVQEHYGPLKASVSMLSRRSSRAGRSTCAPAS